MTYIYIVAVFTPSEGEFNQNDPGSISFHHTTVQAPSAEEAYMIGGRWADYAVIVPKGSVANDYIVEVPEQ